MTDSKEVRITYETLYEMMRQERNTEEVRQLEPSFYRDVLEYLQDKQSVLEKSLSKDDLFSLAERDKTKHQIDNAKKLIKELFERREKKIIELAVNKSRTNSDLVNTANLLNEEKLFFENVVNIFNSWRSDVLLKLLTVAPISVNSANSSSPQVHQASVSHKTTDTMAASTQADSPDEKPIVKSEDSLQDSQQDTSEDSSIDQSSNPSSDKSKNVSSENSSSDVTPEPAEQSSMQSAPDAQPAEIDKPAPTHTQNEESTNEESTTADTKLVLFTEPVEQFMGEECEEYGPFEPQDKAYLPSVLAEILINGGKAKEVKDGV